MSKQPIKVIKRTGKAKQPPEKKVTAKKKRSLESTVKDWIDERRENEDTESRSRDSQLAAWNDDDTPLTEVV